MYQAHSGRIGELVYKSGRGGGQLKLGRCEAAVTQDVRLGI